MSGGDTLGLTVRWETDKLKLTYSSRRLKSAVGRKVARLAKKRLRSGRALDGGPLYEPDERNLERLSNSPLKRTGQLIDSIKYYKGVVIPDPDQHREDSKLNMAGLLGVLIYGRKNWRNRNIRNGARHDPLADSPAIRRFGAIVAQKEIDRQIARGIAKIEGKGKKR